MRYIHFIIIFFSSFTILAQQKYPSLLWKIEGNGLEKPSYLYGTMHVSSKIAFNLSDEFFDALNDVDAIALETNPENWLSYYRDSGLVEVAEHFYNNENSSNIAGFYDIFTEEYEVDLNLFKRLFSSQEPMLNQLLYRYNYGQENYEETTYLDMFIFQSAKKQEKPIYSLEDFLESHFLTERASLPDEDEDEDLYAASNRMDLETAYLEQNLDLIDSLITKNQSKNYRKYLLTIRNQNMVDAMDSLMINESLFSGVGAAHLPGDEGMIQLLINKGYNVTPIKFQKSRKSKKAFEKLKTSAIDLETTKVSSEDKRINFKAPGTFYPQISNYNTGNINTFFSPDYANGAYYSYERLRKDFYIEESLEKKNINYIDSILYLVVPGSIDKTKNTTVSDYPALTVESTLSRGNKIKLLFVDTPQEIIVFKAEGNKSFIKSKNVKKFFKSISIAEGSYLERLNEKGINVHLPSETSLDCYDDFVTVASGHKNGNFFSLKSAQLIDFDNIEQDGFELNYLVDEFAENHNFEALEKTILDKKVIAKLKHKETDKPLNLFYYIHHNNYFQLITDADDPNSFFESLNVSDPENNNNKKELIVDKEKGFQLKTFAKSELNPRIFNEFELLISDFEKAMEKEDSLNRDFEGERKQMLYRNPLNGESASVFYNKVNNYFPLWSWSETLKEQLEEESEDYEMKKVLIDEVYSDSMYSIEFDYVKKGSSRIVKNRAFIIEDRYFNVAVSYDTLLSMSNFAKEFIESFEPFKIDTLGRDFSQNPCEQLFDDLLSEKYQKREQAKKSLDAIRLDSTCRENLKQIMSNKDLDKEIKEDLIYQAENVFDDDKESYLSFLKAFYDEYKHTPGLQSLTLQFIGRVGTEEGAKLFMELLAENPPIIRSDYDSYLLFKGFSDSNELLVHVIQDLQEFAMEYDEFMPRAIYFTDRAIYKDILNPEKIDENFLNAINKRGRKTVRKMAYADSEKNNEYKKQRDELIQIMSIVNCIPNNNHQFDDIIAVTDTITNKRYRAHSLIKRINRDCGYNSREIDSVIADTVEIASFLQWISGKGIKDSIYQSHNLHPSLVYYSYLIQESSLNPENTEIEFLDSTFVSSISDHGLVYLYKVKTEFGGKQLNGVYYADKDDSTIKIEGLNIKTISYSDEDIEAVKEKIVKKINLENRPRVVERNSWGSFNLY